MSKADGSVHSVSQSVCFIFTCQFDLVFSLKCVNFEEGGHIGSQTMLLMLLLFVVLVSKNDINECKLV